MNMNTFFAQQNFKASYNLLSDNLTLQGIITGLTGNEKIQLVICGEPICEIPFMREEVVCKVVFTCTRRLSRDDS